MPLYLFMLVLFFIIGFCFFNSAPTFCPFVILEGDLKKRVAWVRWGCCCCSMPERESGPSYSRNTPTSAAKVQKRSCCRCPSLPWWRDRYTLFSVGRLLMRRLFLFLSLSLLHSHTHTHTHTHMLNNDAHTLSHSLSLSWLGSSLFPLIFSPSWWLSGRLFHKRANFRNFFCFGRSFEKTGAERNPNSCDAAVKITA